MLFFMSPNKAVLNHSEKGEWVGFLPRSLVQERQAIFHWRITPRGRKMPVEKTPNVFPNYAGRDFWRFQSVVNVVRPLEIECGDSGRVMPVSQLRKLPKAQNCAANKSTPFIITFPSPTVLLPPHTQIHDTFTSEPTSTNDQPNLLEQG